ncbi:LLM class F420-dependent oxidoreductase [Mycobacterium aquaticum]|uniref:LLM class F420-dependent oxidoreductase n=1 Tax=Mycobacterium aquaticum TaxID=1927124 RepID=A0A1X0B136_9MYCO|nr:LLM class F420-dependent oxidoreductase [Mycobacterium aquaticum]ORA35909.1 LLM class F420-dependent oxidoreductase [Mycobacterium aquaticum]
MTTPLRSRLGRFGAWLHPGYGDAARTEFAVEAEELGYPTVWLGLGTASVADLTFAERILGATESIIVATAIVNMWTNDAATVAASYRRLTAAYGERFLLGVGIGHPEAVATYRTPYATMVDYLDQLDAAGVPVDGRILAALGPRALTLAAARTLGTHPYLVVPEHTREARAILGPDVVIAPEQTVVVDPDPGAARKIARAFVTDPYLTLSNYTNNLRRFGYTDADLDGQGSDRLIDDLVPHGNAEVVAARLQAHLAAGADHVGVQILTAGGASPMPGYRALAAELFN